MHRNDLLTLLRTLHEGQTTPEAVADRLAAMPYEDLGFAKVDHHRSIRSGLPEVVFSAGKTPEQTASILASIHAAGVMALATRATPEHFAATQALLPDAVLHETARCITCGEPAASRGEVAVICAGTSDLPVAEEAAVTAHSFGAKVSRYVDVGVAGLHRLLAQLESIRRADSVIVCAGMEGALPSVVGGLVSVPVIAVPTSVGYGASFGGLTAMLGMLNSCSPAVSVVNIDNGFGAGYIASLYATRSR